MFNFFRKLAAFVGLFAIPLLVGVAVAQQPQFGTRNPAPRLFPNQQTHYLRFTVNFNDCTLASNTCSVKRAALPYNSFIKAIYGQVITAFNSGTLDDIFITTASGAWTGSPTTGSAAGGSSGAIIATNAPGCNIYQLAADGSSAINPALQQVPTATGSGNSAPSGTTVSCLFTAHGQAAANGMQQIPVWNDSAGIRATGDGDTPTGSNGGFDIFTQYVQTSTAPTAGQEIFVIEYIAPNDGSCVQPALGAVPTPNAC